MNTNEYLTRFFEEKVIPEETFEVMSENGTPNFISNMAVIEQIKLAPAHEKDEIVYRDCQLFLYVGSDISSVCFCWHW